MLNKFLKLSVILTLIAFTSISAAGKEDSQECRVQNLLVGLNSDNTGLQISCAYYLGECKAQCAVLPLMKLLHSAEDPNVRIIAALSLIKIGDERGVFSVERTAIFDESECVRKISNRFYMAFKSNKIDEPQDTLNMLAVNK